MERKYLTPDEWRREAVVATVMAELSEDAPRIHADKISRIANSEGFTGPAISGHMCKYGFLRPVPETFMFERGAPLGALNLSRFRSDDVTVTVSLEGAKSLVSDSAGWGAMGQQEIEEAVLTELKARGLEPPYLPEAAPLAVQPLCKCGHRYDHHGDTLGAGGTACHHSDCPCDHYEAAA